MQLHYELDELKNIEIMQFLPVVLPFIAIGMFLVLFALLDLYRHRKTRENVLLWTIVILFVNTVGPILYFVIGRKESEKI
ncbi:PLD nuclease N-terminal domain-containing protein [Ureibacillus aquaedulcis]|uniref:PLD nuclease N-terminal domain-containing protein n=1 Tax=Ureibacillus aquaedulcis TaxID=3058421 RepID=A0ABT8GS35_9BACL|nr:PLD nuclease N-terminal domain-containing protein [Ureibacillus sp. BA0131]MDN4493766.1 PLD nuclease N-terminal domain-containing protein [Ureibacillus sp. BA0131]